MVAMFLRIEARVSATGAVAVAGVVVTVTAGDAKGARTAASCKAKLVTDTSCTVCVRGIDTNMAEAACGTDATLVVTFSIGAGFDVALSLGTGASLGMALGTLILVPTQRSKMTSRC